MKAAARIAALLAGLAIAAAVCAHGVMDRASPAPGSTVHGSPGEVKLSFSQELEPKFCTVRVVDKSGAQVDRKDKWVDAREGSLLRVSLPPLTPGPYRVIWRVLSKDGHVTKGEFTFNVAP